MQANQATALALYVRLPVICVSRTRKSVSTLNGRSSLVAERPSQIGPAFLRATSSSPVSLAAFLWSTSLVLAYDSMRPRPVTPKVFEQEGPPGGSRGLVQLMSPTVKNQPPSAFCEVDEPVAAGLQGRLDLHGRGGLGSHGLRHEARDEREESDGDHEFQ
jgi:hypothetical protein